MDVEMAYVQDSFLTNDVLQEMVSNLHVAATPGFSLVWFEMPSPYVAKLSCPSFLSAEMTGLPPPHLIG